MPRILLADDHKMFRDILGALLAKQPRMEVVGEAENGRRAVELAQQLAPDVVVMDVDMPELNGVEATRQIREKCPDTKVIALSMHTNRRFVARMVEAGASGYIVKDCAFDELVAAIRAVLAGRTHLASKLDVSPTHRAVQPEAIEPPQLTPREREVVQLLAEGKTTKEAAAELKVSPKTIEVHRKNIMDKLGLKSIVELTKYALQEGLTSLES